MRHNDNIYLIFTIMKEFFANFVNNPSSMGKKWVVPTFTLSIRVERVEQSVPKL